MLQVGLGLGKVDAPLPRLFGPQGFEGGDDDGRLVQVHALDGQARRAFGQLLRGGEQALAGLLGREGGQLGGVVHQVPGQHFVFVGRVHGQRGHEGDAAARRAEHAADVQEGPRRGHGSGQAHLLRHALFAAQGQAEVKKARLALADEAGQGNGGAHVGQGVVRGFMRQAVGGGQVFELEAGQAVFARGPLHAFGAQGVGAAGHVEQIPAAIAVLPFARVRVDKVAPEQMARDFVVKADAVVAHAHGARLGQRGVHAGGKFALRQAALRAKLRGDAGDQAAFRLGQRVCRRAAVQHERLARFVQIGIGADGGELRRPVAARIGPEGFVVVPEKRKRRRGLHAAAGASGKGPRWYGGWQAAGPCSQRSHQRTGGGVHFSARF